MFKKDVTTKKPITLDTLDEEVYNGDNQMYEYGVSSLVNDQAHVYKGASWNDRGYWMSPGTRRFLDQRQSLSTLGFRCAMHQRRSTLIKQKDIKKGSAIWRTLFFFLGF